MAHNVKTCLQLSNVFRNLKICNKPNLSRNFSGLVTCSQIRHNAFSFIQPQLLGVSIQHLPGNRCQAVAANSFGPCRTKRTSVADTKISWNLGAVGVEPTDDFTSISDQSVQTAITHQINDTLEHGKEGRLYAVVHVRSLQYKVTAGDVIVIKHDFPPNVGDKIRLEKVLAVGGSDFTLFGQPLLSRDKVFVEATVVEKTLSNNRAWFVYRKRMNFQKFHLYREQQTMLVINSVRVAKLNEGDCKQIEDANQA